MTTRLTGESSENGRWDEGLVMLRCVVPLLDVVFEGQTLLVDTQGARAAVLVEAVVGWNPLHVCQGGLAAPGLQLGVRAIKAVHALQGVLISGVNCTTRERRQDGLYFPF